MHPRRCMHPRCCTHPQFCTHAWCRTHPRCCTLAAVVTQSVKSCPDTNRLASTTELSPEIMDDILLGTSRPPAPGRPRPLQRTSTTGTLHFTRNFRARQPRTSAANMDWSLSTAISCGSKCGPWPRSGPRKTPTTLPSRSIFSTRLAIASHM